MANPGVGTKFVSVNLNKSYGQQQQQQRHQQRSSSTSSGNLAGGGNRIRSGGVGNGIGGGAGGGGGMVLLSRSRNTSVGVQKGGPKLSIPPPLNLPSLRKEHERFDSASSGAGSVGAGNSGAGARPASSGIGWTKPAPAPTPLPLEKDTGMGNDHLPLGVGSLSVNSGDPYRGNNSVYMPPSARSGSAAGQSTAVASFPDFPSVQRAAVLRGEDFPSLQATIPSVSGSSQKQKDTLSQKQNQKEGGEPDEKMGNSHLRPTQTQNQSSRVLGKTEDDKEGVNRGFCGPRNNEQSRKQDDFFPSPLPLVRLNHTSDWADDERDTGHGLPDQDRDQGYSRNEFYRDRDFDFPKISVPPRTSYHDHSEGRGLRHDVGRLPSGGFLRGNTYNRDVRSPNREGHNGSSWRAPSLMKDGFSGDRNGIAAMPLPVNRDNSKENKYGRSPFGDSARDGFSSGLLGTHDSRFGRRDMDYGQGIRQAGNHMTDSYSGRGNEQTKLDYYGDDLPNRNRSDSSQSRSFIKTSGKGFFGNDPVLSSSREKRLTSGKQYLEEPFMKDFSTGPDFDGTFVGIFKRKKDMPRQADYHDPARESFEAELERVQKLQEQERQRVIEEQTRALELARKEEEDRERVAREEEERRRRIEEEAREAAWRAEQERLEAIRRVEEQKIAREEEKRRMLLEEERRKEAANQKLLELEARMARRQAENTKAIEFLPAARDERIHVGFHKKDVARVADVVDWEDGERMVERITSSASSDSSSLNRSLEMNSRPNLYRDGDSTFSERGKASNYWRRDEFENGSSSTFNWQDQDNGYRSPNRDAYGAGRAFVRKEYSGGPGIITAKTSARGGLVEPPLVDDFPHLRGYRWNLAGDGDPYTKNSDINPEFHDNSSDRFNDVGWEIGWPHGHHHSFYPERPYQNSDTDGFSSFGKARHSTRQPWVPPPPSLAAMNKNTFRSQIDPPSSSTFRDSEMSYQHATRKSEQISQTGYGDIHEEELDQSREVETQRENTSSQDQQGAKTSTSRCDSQSSLSVSSPPSSPTHLSHDDLDDSSESLVLPTATEEDRAHLSDNERSFSVTRMSTASKLEEALSAASLVEDEEWDIEDHLDLLEQEEYDEEENYREEDEVQEEDDENVELLQEFEDLHLEEKDSSIKNQLVLDFDESVDVVMRSGDYSERASEEAGSPGGLVHVGQNVQSEDTSSKGRVENSGTIQEAEEKLQNLGDQLVTDVPSSDASAGVLLDALDASSTSSLPPHQLQTSPVDVTLPSSTTEPNVSAVSITSSQPDLPVKLQFGLFTGPSLIPSPVPAIQIGSIQMPLHIHPQVGPSLTQMHPPQPPFFQFGQLRYASPISQGILPLGPQSMSFVQSSIPGQNSFKQNQNGSSSNQDSQDPSVQNHSTIDKPAGISIDDQPGVRKLLGQSQEYPCKEVNMLSVRQGASHCREDSSLIGDRNMRPGSTSQVDSAYRYFDSKKSYRSSFNSKEWHGQPHVESNTSRFVSKAPGPTSGSKGKRYSTIKNSWSRPSPPVSEYPHSGFRGFQRRARPKLPRTEFRVRENVDKRQSETLISSHDPQPEKPTFSGSVSGTSVQSGVKENLGDKTLKQLVDSEGMNSEVPSKKVTSHYISHSREGNPKRNNSFDEDIDAPLQSGVVHVFKQPGIEAPSDEDDFIEVRSKRQMLNDRREQREKEIKAKANIIKAPKKRRSVSQNNRASSFSNKTSTSLGREASNSTYTKPVTNNGRTLEKPTRFSNRIVSPPLAPIGTPSINTDAHADTRPYTTKSPHTGSIPVISTNGLSLVPALSFEKNNMSLNSVPTSLSPWGDGRMNQQFMALTQTQLDEAMKPARFEKHVASIGDRNGAVIDPNKLSSSIVTQDKSFSSTVSPLNSLLAGERIQFGAVTSPTIIPSSSQSSNRMGSPGSGLEDDCSLFFEKDKRLNESCVDREEAEAEAAASAVAVAAFSNDEMVTSGCSGAVTETSSGGADKEGLAPEGTASHQQLGSQSRAEESLSVALPADLSVETPSLSMWPSLPSPQHSSGQMLSHFPGGAPSHFPCYEMNPMLGGPIFTFAPHDENAGTQSQLSSVSGSGSLGTWQQCHSGVDSFYGPPAGYTGSFISPPGGIPGVQCPPHMVVYNHFTPVGQFGQVGLSFMGATYIPSGKQLDWKHNPASTAMVVGDGDINNLNIPSAQHNSSSMPPPVQHPAPGSPLLPMASPLAMFDMSPFQSSTDMPVQARWSHFSASSHHSAPMSMPLPQHPEGMLPSQFSHGSPVGQSTGNIFQESCSSSALDGGRNFPMQSCASVTQFPDELGLIDTFNTSTSTTRVAASRTAAYRSTMMNGKAQTVVTKNSNNIAANVGDGSSINSKNNNTKQNLSSSIKTRSAQQQTSTQQYLRPSGYTDRRVVGVSHNMASGGEWAHRRMGFHGRNQSSGTDKKVKQIYVAKPTTSRTSTNLSS